MLELNDTNWKCRVVQERDDLLEKTTKLANFIDTKAFSYLPPESRRLLMLQETIMRSYIAVLDMRISR